MPDYKLYTCIVCRLRGDRDNELLHWGTRNYTHAACGLKRFGESFLNQLSVEQLETIPEAVLREHGFFDFWRGLLHRKQQYSKRVDLSAGRHSVRVI
jgi:hypothetical protein